VYCPKKIHFFPIAGMILLIALFISPSALQAQRRGGGSGGGRDMSERMELMTKKQDERQFKKLCVYLELDKQQNKKALKLFKNMQKQTDKIAGEVRKGKIDPTEAGNRRIDTYKAYREKFRNLLNEEQKMKYEKTRETGLKEASKK